MLRCDRSGNVTGTGDHESGKDRRTGTDRSAREDDNNPAMLYNLNAGRVTEGGPADLVLFDPDKKWTVEDHFYSKANNSPFIGMELTGKVQYTICGGKIVYQAG